MYDTVANEFKVTGNLLNTVAVNIISAYVNENLNYCDAQNNSYSYILNTQ